MSFEGIIGNDKIKNELQEVLYTGNISHSYLFIGQEGIGKKKIAEEFAKMILCLSEDKKPCNTCSACIKFNTCNNPDFIEVEPDGNSLKIAQLEACKKKYMKSQLFLIKKLL